MLQCPQKKWVFMFDWFKKSTPTLVAPPPEARGSFFSTDGIERVSSRKVAQAAINSTFQKTVDEFITTDGTMDSIDSVKASMTYNMGGISDGQLSWYGAQGFIGYQACAMLAQNWLIEKACNVPARDAIRKGWEITVNDGTEIDPDVLDKITQLDSKHKLKQNLIEFVKFGRVFGIRIAMFKVESTDPLYYEKPYNPDGITEGCYKGISQVDPYWMAPELNQESAADPSSINFYEPTYWTIGGKRIHRSHLIIMRASDVPDILKPTYLYGGVSVPQKIYERVYCAERTANEAPQLVMTKRTNILKTDAAAALANQGAFETAMGQHAYYRDNYGIKVIDKETEDMVQFDTALGDLDVVIMTQYQLVASIANVPVTKLLGTTPKGFNSSGEYEEASYREELESIQAFDLAPLIDRHHELLIRSEIAPMFGIAPFDTTCVFNALDSLTELEQADVNLKQAQTDQALQATGAIDGHDIRARIIADPKSGYNGIADEEALPDEELTL